jgi:2'-5' RNA ligase
MGESKNAYAVSINFDGEIEKLLDELRGDLHQYVDYIMTPHITLVYPFAPADGIESVINRLEGVAGRQKPFSITLKDIRYFETVNNVAYIGVADKSRLETLTIDIIESIRDTVTGYYAEKGYDARYFIPHLTIGEKIPHHIFPEVKKRFAGYQISHECEVSSFSLGEEENGRWEVVRGFNLEGNNTGLPPARE